MLSLGFVQSVANPCVFIRVLKDKPAIVTVHVDDLIRLTETAEETIDLKTNLANHFQDEGCGYTPPLSKELVVSLRFDDAPVYDAAG